jgi:hypothetical protein
VLLAAMAEAGVRRLVPAGPMVSAVLAFAWLDEGRAFAASLPPK